MIKEVFKMIGAVGVAFGILFCVAWFVRGGQVGTQSRLNQAQVIASEKNNTDSDVSDIYAVSRVVDGDTIVVLVDGKKETVRLIGVNTPETVDPRKPVECFGKEASNFVKNILTGKQVRLVPDLTQSDRDKYGRLLRYVYLGDVLVNEEIISSGYGFEYTYDIPYEFQQEFKGSERYAREGKLGLWGVCR